MSRVPAASPALSLTIDFVNSHDLLADPPDRLSVAYLRRIAVRHDLAPLVTPFTDADMPGLRALRARIYRVFSAGDLHATAEALNDLLTAHTRGVRLDAADPDDARLVAVAGHSPLDRFAATLADALAQAVIAGGAGRLGICAGDPCRCVYVDRTRAARQRYCCDLCNDRVAAAVYRRRQPGVASATS
jgi:predicted RNA-binding Zn ribbon-like protein